MAQSDPNDTYAHLTRGKAAKLINHVRGLLANRVEPDKIEAVLLDVYDVQPLTRCPGEAHQNGRADHCAVCSPRWGHVGPEVKVR